MAAGVQAAQQSLKFQRTINDVDAKLQRRPDADALVEHNILKAHSAGRVAPALHATAQQLKFNRTVGVMDKKLETRTSREWLRRANILKDEKVSPNLVATSQELKFNRTVVKVNSQLANRPPRDELLEQHILAPAGPLVQTAHNALARHRIEASLDEQLATRTALSSPDSLSSRSRASSTASVASLCLCDECDDNELCAHHSKLAAAAPAKAADGTLSPRAKKTPPRKAEPAASKATSESSTVETER